MCLLIPKQLIFTYCLLSKSLTQCTYRLLYVYQCQLWTCITVRFDNKSIGQIHTGIQNCWSFLSFSIKLKDSEAKKQQEQYTFGPNPHFLGYVLRSMMTLFSLAQIPWSQVDITAVVIWAIAGEETRDAHSWPQYITIAWHIVA